MKTSSFSLRVRFIFILIILFSILLTVRLYFLQIVNGDIFLEKADRQYTTVSNNVFDRGSIFFQTKDGSLVSAATLKTGYTVAVSPKLILDGDLVYKTLSQYLTLDPAVFYSKMLKKNDPYEEIARKVPEEIVKKIDAEKITGLIIQKEKWRYYPGESLAARLTGFVGYNDVGDALEGRYGLEKYYNDTLVRDGGDIYVNVFAEIFSNINKNFIQDSQREGDIITTINPEVEGYLENALSQTTKKWNSKITGGIVIDPKTGEIYAMGVYPEFNLNDFSKEKDVGVFSNPLVSDSYELGSVIKAITMASGFDSGVISAKTTFTDYGFIELDGYKVYNVDKKSRGKTSMQDVLNHSMNTGATFVMQSMGRQKFLDYFKRFGIGTETGIDLPGESAGNIDNLTSNLSSSKQIEFANASFGQGFSMTPIAATRAFSVLANGGKLITPHVVSRIDYKVGLSKKVSYIDEAQQIISKGTSEEITRMLVNLVDTALIQGQYKIEHYSVAAKTGTAQIARSAKDGGGYYPDRFLHSFFGYFPAYNPRFLVFLYTIEPQNIDFASNTLSKPFFDIAKYLINYYEIPPDR
ncbi:MAG: penicillin-binding protein 2 [Candidatus Paceibacterota bacterium]|jgi:cell division protein FtsI/penicillin-binding protein 2